MIPAKASLEVLVTLTKALLTESGTDTNKGVTKRY